MNLVRRAEQALLGALLRDPGQIDSARFVSPSDFTEAQHQAIFTAIMTAHADYLGGIRMPPDLAAALAARNPGFDLDQLRELGRSCPEPANAPAYARMVIETSLRQLLATQAGRLFEDAGRLDHEMGRLTNAAPSAHSAGRFPGHLLKLAHAMQAHAKGFDPDTGISPDPASASEGDPARAQEEEVLAGLIQHFWPNCRVLDWLPAEAFGPGPPREVYLAIAMLARDGEPVDPLTVDWQLARNRCLVQTVRSGAGHAADPGYVTKLAARTISEGTATLTGRVLLNRYATEQLQARQAGSLPAVPGAGERPAVLPSAAPGRNDQAIVTVSVSGPGASIRIHSPHGGRRPLLQPPPGQGTRPGQPPSQGRRPGQPNDGPRP